MLPSSWWVQVQLAGKKQVYIDDHMNPLSLREQPRRWHRHDRRKLRRTGR